MIRQLLEKLKVKIQSQGRREFRNSDLCENCRKLGVCGHISKGLRSVGEVEGALRLCFGDVVCYRQLRPGPFAARNLLELLGKPVFETLLVRYEIADMYVGSTGVLDHVSDMGAGPPDPSTPIGQGILGTEKCFVSFG